MVKSERISRSPSEPLRLRMGASREPIADSVFLLPFSHKCFVMLLPATGGFLLNLCVFALESPSDTFGSNGFLDKVLRAILFVDP